MYTQAEKYAKLKDDPELKVGPVVVKRSSSRSDVDGLMRSLGAARCKLDLSCLSMGGLEMK